MRLAFLENGTIWIHAHAGGTPDEDQSDAARSPGNKLGKRPGAGSFPGSSEGSEAADTLISDVWPLEPGDNTFLWFKPLTGRAL